MVFFLRHDPPSPLSVSMFFMSLHVLHVIHVRIRWTLDKDKDEDKNRRTPSALQQLWIFMVVYTVVYVVRPLLYQHVSFHTATVASYPC